MIVHLRDFGGLVYVPELHKSILGRDGQQIPSLVPLDGSDRVEVLIVDETVDLVGLEIPEVNAVGESHRENVVVAPIEDIDVEVVLEVRSIENLEGVHWVGVFGSLLALGDDSVAGDKVI